MGNENSNQAQDPNECRGDGCYETSFGTHATQSEILKAGAAQSALDNFDGWGDAVRCVNNGMDKSIRWDATPDNIVGSCDRNYDRQREKNSEPGEKSLK
jgi:hypothetical protein